MARPLPCAVMILLALVSSPAATQDIPGVERCTAEKQMERRTGCLQNNDEYLQRTLSKATRDMEARLIASGRELAAARSEIAALKAAVEKLNAELSRMKAKLEPTGKK